MVRVCFPSTLHREIPSKCDGCTWDINQSDMPYSLWQINFALFPKKFGTSAHLTTGAGVEGCPLQGKPGRGRSQVRSPSAPSPPCFPCWVKITLRGISRHSDIKSSKTMRNVSNQMVKDMRIQPNCGREENRKGDHCMNRSSHPVFGLGNHLYIDLIQLNNLHSYHFLTWQR